MPLVAFSLGMLPGQSPTKSCTGYYPDKSPTISLRYINRRTVPPVDLRLIPCTSSRARDGYAPDAKCLWWHSRSGCCPDRARHSPWHSLSGPRPQEALEKKAAAYAAAPSVIHFLLFQQLLLLQPLTLSILHNLSYNRYCNPLYLHRIFYGIHGCC